MLATHNPKNFLTLAKKLLADDKYNNETRTIELQLEELTMPLFLPRKQNKKKEDIFFQMTIRFTRQSLIASMMTIFRTLLANLMNSKIIGQTLTITWVFLV